MLWRVFVVGRDGCMWDFNRDIVLPVFGPEVRWTWAMVRASPTTMP